MNLIGIRVEKYKATRHWAVWVNDQLLAVTVYKKGAVAIKRALLAMQGETGRWRADSCVQDLM